MIQLPGGLKKTLIRFPRKRRVATVGLPNSYLHGLNFSELAVTF